MEHIDDFIVKSFMLPTLLFDNDQKRQEHLNKIWEKCRESVTMF